ncbi:MAG: cytochrome c peroxidase [Bryobacteraceae bacterium]
MNIRISLCLLAATAIAAAQGPGHHGGPMSGPMGGRMMGTLPKEISSDANPITTAKVDLGRMLFYETRLSKGRDVSCNSCHDLARYGVDGTAVSTGHEKQTGNRNSPTVYHAAGHIAQFWDGRAADVEAQAKGPVLNPVEMAMASDAEVAATLRAIPGYVTAFQRAFPGEAEPVTFENMARAIGAFERKLVTPSRWDRFLAGDRRAITSQEMAGHHEFMHGGCATCHNGPYVGGGMFQRLGAKKAWPSETDLGRMTVTKAETDRLVFKVPSLRNVEKTAPYFHDGKVPALDRAVRLMGEHQLGVTLSDEQVTQIVAWLKTLTGEIPRDYIRKPKLPE